MQKKIIILIVLAVVAAAFGVAATGSDDSDAAATYTKDGFTYSLTDKGDESQNTAQITRINANVMANKEVTIPAYIMDDGGTKYHVTAVNVAFSGYTCSGTSVIIESNPGLILPQNMFMNTYVKSVKIGDGIDLPNGIFTGCGNLETLTLPSTLTSIPSSAFARCWKLTEIDIGDKVTSIGNNAFQGCTKITTIDLPDTLKSIGSSAFQACTGLTTIDLPDSLVSIGSNAFKGCSKIESLNIGPNVESIGAGAFSGTKITSVVISENLREIEVGESCFLDDLDSISVPEGNPYFSVDGGVLYNKDKSVLLYYPRSVTTEDGTFTTSASIGDYAFYKTCLTKITVTDGAVSVGKSAFGSSTMLKEISLPDSVKSIGESAFSGCSALTALTLPKNPDSIGAKAFSGSGITEITIESGLTSIEGMFSDCTNLQSVTLPATVTAVGKSAFDGCSSLTTVKFLGNITSIGERAFEECVNLTSVTLSDTIETIGNRAFYNDGKLEITALPSGLTSVGTYAFYGCTGLKITELPDSLTEINSNAFFNTGIESITVGAVNAVEFKVSSNISSGKFNAFGGSALKSICLNKVTLAEENVKYAGTLVSISDNLENYELGSDFTLWKWVDGVGLNEEKKTAYLLKPGVTKFTIPSTVDTVSGAAFQNTGITEIAYAGDSSRTITFDSGSTTSMFYNCKSLVKVTLPNIVDAKNNSSGLFNNCTAIKEMEIGGMDTLGKISTTAIIMDKFVLHSCKTINNWPYAYYMEIPSNVTKVKYTNMLQDGSGKDLFSVKGTITSADEIAKVAGKSLVWNGSYSNRYPICTPVDSDQATVCLDYGDAKAYVAVDKGTAFDPSEYSHMIYDASKWYTDSTKAAEYSDAAVSEDITLYADAAQRTFKVTVSADEGDTYTLYCDDKEITSGDAVPYGSYVKLVAPQKEGYDGYINGNTIPELGGVGTTVYADTVMTLKYSQQKYTLTFSAVGADSIASITAPSGSEYDKPADPVRTGYKFVGWTPALPDKIPTVRYNYGMTYSYSALWAPATVSIYFDTDGGDAVASVTRLYNTTYGDLPAATKTGYTFAGWYTAAEDGTMVKYTDVVKSAEGVTLYAKWTVNQYTITFNTDGGSDVAAITQDYGTAVTAPANPSKDGSTFLGWDKTVPKTMPGENITLKALWGTSGQYSICFDTDGGSSVDTIVASSGATVAKPTDPAKEGYIFQFWSEDGTTEYTFSAMPEKNLTLKAVWKAVEYTITFNTDGGAPAVAEIKQAYGTDVAAPTETVTKTGYKFQFWSKDGKTEYRFGTMPAESFTLTAVWKIESYGYTIKYQDNNGKEIASDVTGTAPYDTDVYAQRIILTGYTVPASSQSIHITTDPDSNVLIYKYTPNKYTISFDTDGGTPDTIPSITQDYGTEVSAPDVTLTKEGYEFQYWMQRVWKYTFTTMPAENITLKASWTPKVYTITFDSDGGSEVSSMQRKYTFAISAPAAPTKEGYTFRYWSEDGTNEYIFGTMPAKDLNLTAVWKVNQYTISFDTDGGSPVPAAITQDYNTAVTAPTETVAKTGYTFQFWSKDGTTAYTFGTMPAENIILKAVWDANPYGYTVKYQDANGKTLADDKTGTADFGTEVDAELKTITGYTAPSAAKIAITEVAENNVMIYTYAINSYTITFDTDGGSAVSAITQDYGTSVTAPADPTKTGYVFLKWDPAVPATVPAENVTVKAVWAVSVKADDKGEASVDLGSEGGTFIPAAGTETVTVSMGSSTSVKVESASDLAGKTVVSEVKKISNPASGTVSGSAYEFTFTADGAQYSGKILATLPYTGESGKEPAVYYWNGTTAEKMKVVDYTDTSVTFETSHNSTYVVTAEDKEEGGNGLFVIIAVAAVLAIAVFGLAYYFEVVRKKSA